MKAFCLIMTIILAIVIVVKYCNPKWNWERDIYYYDYNQKIAFYILIPSFIVFLLATCLLYS